MLCVAILTLTNRCLEDCRMICRAAACLTLCLLLWIADCDAQPVGTVTVVVLRVNSTTRQALRFSISTPFSRESGCQLVPTARRLMRGRETTRACVSAQRKLRNAAVAQNFFVYR